jgi:hypothetical protein
MQRYDCVENAESPPDAPIRFHHTIENRSGSGVQVRLHKCEISSMLEKSRARREIASLKKGKQPVRETPKWKGKSKLRIA